MNSSVLAGNAEGPAVQRLMRLGFGRQECQQALQMCNGSEDQAAPLLFERKKWVAVLLANKVVFLDSTLWQLLCPTADCMMLTDGCNRVLLECMHVMLAP